MTRYVALLRGINVGGRAAGPDGGPADLDHRQPATVGIEGVALPGELFLPGQQLPARGRPLLARRHLRQAHACVAPATVSLLGTVGGVRQTADMGIRNKQRRAAKARAKDRQRRRSQEQGRWQDHHPGCDCGVGAELPPPVELVEAALLGGAAEHLGGRADAIDRCVEDVIAGIGEHPEVIDAAARRAVEGMVTEAWRRGWLPEDVHQMARRHHDREVAGYVVDAIAAEHQRYPRARIHGRWQEQLHQIEAEVWWQPAQPFLPQWAARHSTDLAGTLRAAIGALALLDSLPTLPRILPLPGTVSGAGATTQRRVDPKVLARVRGLLAKAESTGFAEEAEALSAKAQELMARHALERAVVDADAADGPAVTARRLWLDAPYIAAKGSLVGSVAAANRCRTVLFDKLGFITVLGDEVDLGIVEVLSTSLLVQATRAMVAGGSRIDRRGQSRTRSYRQSFLISYAARIRERLARATEEAGSPACGADTSRLLPVLAARERAVDEFVTEMFPNLRYRSQSVSNAQGWYAGRAAADLAVLDAHRSLSS